MVVFLEEFNEVLDAPWVRDYPPGQAEGFSDDFLADKADYCSRRDDRVTMTWDSEGHLKVPTGPLPHPLVISSSHHPHPPSSSSSNPACYEARIMGRFFEGHCSSSSSSSSCSSSFCKVPSGRLHSAIDLEQKPKDLKLCFDELGHLASVYLCGQLRWNMDGWHETSTDPNAKLQPEHPSSSQHEGVSIIAYIPIDESSSSSSHCDLDITSGCEPMAVWRVKLTFDGLGHLYMVSQVVETELPCGVMTQCSNEPIPKNILVVWRMTNVDFPGAIDAFLEQCTIARWDGCKHVGTVVVPCCHRDGLHFTYTETVVSYSIACIPQTGPGPHTTPWWLCFLDTPHQFLTFNPCPTDGEAGGNFKIGLCDRISFSAHVMEIPCHLECESGSFPCDAPSSSHPESGGGGPA